jgi:hypothetical protein
MTTMNESILNDPRMFPAVTEVDMNVIDVADNPSLIDTYLNNAEAGHPMTTTTTTLPPPTKGHRSFASVRVTPGLATAAVKQLGDTFTISDQLGGEYIKLRAQGRADVVILSISRDGIPALIAELQRLSA